MVTAAVVGTGSEGVADAGGVHAGAAGLQAGAVAGTPPPDRAVVDGAVEVVELVEEAVVADLVVGGSVAAAVVAGEGTGLVVGASPGSTGWVEARPAISQPVTARTATTTTVTTTMNAMRRRRSGSSVSPGPAS